MLVARLVADVGLEDGIDVADVLFFVGGAISVLTLFGLIRGLPLFSRICDFFKWWESFRDYWDGQPPEPGRDRVPGIPERLNRIDGELQRNGGGSLKDAVFETKRLTKELKHTADVLVGRMDASDEVRSAILSVSMQNAEATQQAFITNGLTPPTYLPIAIPVSRHNHPERDHHEEDST